MKTAIYKRVSSKSQDTKAQSVDLDAYRKTLEDKGDSVVEYSDKFTGKTLNRPGWERLWADVVAGKVDRIVVWRLDRLGRTVSGLSRLFEDLMSRKVSLVSLKDSLDLGTAAGRLMAHVLASVAAYELEVKNERQIAGIEAARQENGGSCPWGGRKAGTRNERTMEVEKAVKDMSKSGCSISEISRVVKLSRPTVYKLLGA